MTWKTLVLNAVVASLAFGCKPGTPPAASDSDQLAKEDKATDKAGDKSGVEDKGKAPAD